MVLVTEEIAGVAVVGGGRGDGSNGSGSDGGPEHHFKGYSEADSLLFTPDWRGTRAGNISRNITSLAHVKNTTPFPLLPSLPPSSFPHYFDRAGRMSDWLAGVGRPKVKWSNAWICLEWIMLSGPAG